MRLPWKKYLTREYSFLYIAYAYDCYKIMQRVVGTTIRYDMAVGQGNLVTLYGIEKDFQHCYQLIEKIARARPQAIVWKMDRFDELVAKNYRLLAQIKKSTRRAEIRSLLLELNATFFETLCFYLFFVYLGYGGNFPGIAKFLRRQGKRFNTIRTYTIDTDMNKLFPRLFGRYDKKLAAWASYMKPSELVNFLNRKPIDFQRIRNRQRAYLLVMKHHHVKEYDVRTIPRILQREISHLLPQPKVNFVKGSVACLGNVRGVVRVIFSEKDYRKIKRGDIIVTPMTKPTIVPWLSKVKGIVTNDGGALSHASIISREMKIPCIVGTMHATDVFKDGDVVTLDTGRGVVTKAA